MLLGIICTILGVLGVYGFFSANLILVIIGGIASIIENLLGVISGQQKSLMTPILAIIIGAIYASSAGIPVWIGVFIGLCFESAIMGILGFVGLLVAIMFAGDRL
jgi:hypothetical protein